MVDPANREKKAVTREELRNGVDLQTSHYYLLQISDQQAGGTGSGSSGDGTGSGGEVSSTTTQPPGTTTEPPGTTTEPPGTTTEPPGTTTTQPPGTTTTKPRETTTTSPVTTTTAPTATPSTTAAPATGVIHLVVWDADEKPLEGAVVKVFHGDDQVASATTSASGEVRIDGLVRAEHYVVKVNDQEIEIVAEPSSDSGDGEDGAGELGQDERIALCDIDESADDSDPG
jgi:hypothetical protein